MDSIWVEYSFVIPVLQTCANPKPGRSGDFPDSATNRVPNSSLTTLITYTYKGTWGPAGYL